MILASDSHTRYGALGTMAIGEGGPEIVKQLLEKPTIWRTRKWSPSSWPASRPRRRPAGRRAGDHPGRLSKRFREEQGMEFVGPGVAASDGLPQRHRRHDHRDDLPLLDLADGRKGGGMVPDPRPTGGLRPLEPGDVSYYDGLIEVDLAKVGPMIALPFHPSNAFPIAELNGTRTKSSGKWKRRERSRWRTRIWNSADGQARRRETPGRPGHHRRMRRRHIRQHRAMAEILNGKIIGDGEFSLSVYPASQPILLELVRNRSIENLMSAGAVIRTAFCGPCFGAGDIPANNGLSIRHATRNFPNREGSIPARARWPRWR